MRGIYAGWVGIALLVAGCGEAEPDRYELSGKVSYDGQPVPKGYIVFTPDASRGNNGPGSHADIENGEYRTPPEAGILGGAYAVKINGFDGKAYQVGDQMIEQGAPLFPTHEIRIELDAANGSRDFDVPRQGE